MSLNPTGTVQSHNWNYTKPEKPNYTLTLVGTVVALQEVQKRAFTNNGTPGMPEFWPEGNPKMNIRIALAAQDGSLRSFTFQPASKRQRQEGTGVHMQLFGITGNTDMMKLIGKTLQFQTQDAPEGTRYGAGNPRPFVITEVQAGPYSLNEPLPTEFTVPQLLCNDAASGGQVQPMQPMQVQVPQPAYDRQGYYAVPGVTPQQQVAQNMNMPVQQAQPVMQQQPVGTVQPMVPNMPAGMDPQVAAAMANMQATNVQPVEPGSVYDADIPF